MRREHSYDRREPLLPLQIKVRMTIMCLHMVMFTPVESMNTDLEVRLSGLTDYVCMSFSDIITILILQKISIDYSVHVHVHRSIVLCPLIL